MKIENEFFNKFAFIQEQIQQREHLAISILNCSIDLFVF